MERLGLGDQWHWCDQRLLGGSIAWIRDGTVADPSDSHPFWASF